MRKLLTSYRNRPIITNNIMIHAVTKPSTYSDDDQRLLHTLRVASSAPASEPTSEPLW